MQVENSLQRLRWADAHWARRAADQPCADAGVVELVAARQRRHRLPARTFLLADRALLCRGGIPGLPLDAAGVHDCGTATCCRINEQLLGVHEGSPELRPVLKRLSLAFTCGRVRVSGA